MPVTRYFYFTRQPFEQTRQHPKLKRIQGSILDAGRVAEVVYNADAMLSVPGHRTNKPEFVISRSIDNILRAMRKFQIRSICRGSDA